MSPRRTAEEIATDAEPRQADPLPTREREIHLRVGDRPPVEGHTVSVRLRPADRAKLEELQAHYGLDVSETLRTCLAVAHKALTALQAIHGGKHVSDE